MVNLVSAQRPLVKLLMKIAGITPHQVDLEDGTTINIWLPSNLNNPQKRKPKTLSPSSLTILPPKKPAVVLIHGFAAEGIATWQFQVASLTKKYSVYIPDLVFFGQSTTVRAERSPEFQAECMVRVLRKVGVENCTVVGFSYGGIVAVKMAIEEPGLVNSIVLTGSTMALTPCISSSTLSRLGFFSPYDLLLPTSVEGLKALLSVAAYKKLRFPHRLLKDFLQVMFEKRREKKELLEEAVGGEEEVPRLSQKIHLLWGENDEIFKVEMAHRMKEELGEQATIEVIKKAGHLVHIERPCAYNNSLNRILSNVAHSLHFQTHPSSF